MSTDVRQAPTTVTLAVEGINCGSCVRHVSDALVSNFDLVDHAVDLAGKKVTVTFGPGAATPEAIAKVLDEAGYPARPV